MRIGQVIEALNSMKVRGIVEDYAIGGAVAATFYVQPAATLDVDVFVAFQPPEEKAILDPTPIFGYLVSQGFAMDGEYVVIAGWPVQILAPSGPLVEEALCQAVAFEVEGENARVFSAEHLAAICLETGRAKDKVRLLQFIEEGALDAERFQDIVTRHGLTPDWERFAKEFLEDRP